MQQTLDACCPPQSSGVAGSTLQMLPLAAAHEPVAAALPHALRLRVVKEVRATWVSS